MKKMISILLIAAMGLTMTGCYGSFTLTKKVYKWNGTMENDMVTNVVFWAMVIVPVYSSCLFIDAALLNTIEHWTGDNPLAFENTFDTIKTIETPDGTYTVTMGNYRILIEELENLEVVNSQTFQYDATNQVWLLNDNGEESNLAVIGEDSVMLMLPDGGFQEITLSN